MFLNISKKLASLLSFFRRGDPCVPFSLPLVIAIYIYTDTRSFNHTDCPASGFLLGVPVFVCFCRNVKLVVWIFGCSVDCLTTFRLIAGM